jgi:hypothetical protein
MTNFRSPTTEERAFLRIVTFGHPELEAQIESCEITDYDPDGYCDVRVRCGPPSRIGEACDGPSLLIGDKREPLIQTMLWTNNEGMLDTIEFLVLPGGSDKNIYERYIRAAADGNLVYPNNS